MAQLSGTSSAYRFCKESTKYPPTPDAKILKCPTIRLREPKSFQTLDFCTIFQNSNRMNAVYLNFTAFAFYNFSRLHWKMDPDRGGEAVPHPCRKNVWVLRLTNTCLIFLCVISSFPLSWWSESDSVRYHCDPRSSRSRTEIESPAIICGNTFKSWWSVVEVVVVVAPTTLRMHCPVLFSSWPVLMIVCFGWRNANVKEGCWWRHALSDPWALFVVETESAGLLFHSLSSFLNSNRQRRVLKRNWKWVWKIRRIYFWEQWAAKELKRTTTPQPHPIDGHSG